MKPLLVVAHAGFRQQTRDSILHLNHLTHEKVAVSQRSSPPSYLRGCHVAFRQEVAAQAVGDLARIDAVVLLRGCNGSQHQRVCHLHMVGMRKQVIIGPAAEHRGLHRHCPRLRQETHPLV